MYNTQLYNLGLYNGNVNLEALAVSEDQIAFNGFSISNGTTIITTDLYIEQIERDFAVSDVPQGVGQIINNDFWRKKKIKVSGYITGDDAIEFENLIFEFKKNMAAKQGRLDIKMADGSTRRFICTQVGDEMVERGKHYHITHAPFELEFECSTPFGTAPQPTSEGFTITDLIHSGALTNEGNATADVDFIFIFNNADGVSAINIRNATTGEEIEINETVQSGQIVIFSGKEKTATINGVEVDFVGSFITAQVGENNYTLTITGASVEYELTTNTPKNFL